MSETNSTSQLDVIPAPEQPTDPRHHIPSLTIATENLHTRVLRLEYGLRFGFRSLEVQFGRHNRPRGK